MRNLPANVDSSIFNCSFAFISAKALVNILTSNLSQLIHLLECIQFIDVKYRNIIWFTAGRPHQMVINQFNGRTFASKQCNAIIPIRTIQAITQYISKEPRTINGHRICLSTSISMHQQVKAIAAARARDPQHVSFIEINALHNFWFYLFEIFINSTNYK